MHSRCLASSTCCRKWLSVDSRAAPGLQILVGRLYIASAVQASNWELLSDLKVTHIVNCSRSCNFDGTGSNPFSAEINYCSCGFADNASVGPGVESACVIMWPRLAAHTHDLSFTDVRM